MATTRRIARERKLKRMSADLTTRNKLKAIIKSPNSTPDEVLTAVLNLQKRPVDESPIRARRRCQICGRSRGVYRKFELCRCCIRKYAMLGMIPGLVKSSW